MTEDSAPVGTKPPGRIRTGLVGAGAGAAIAVCAFLGMGMASAAAATDDEGSSSPSEPAHPGTPGSDTAEPDSRDTDGRRVHGGNHGAPGSDGECEDVAEGSTAEDATGDAI